MVDVVAVHVGEAEAFGTGGADGTGFTVKLMDDEHPFASFTVSVYGVGLGATPGNIGDTWKLIPSIE